MVFFKEVIQHNKKKIEILKEIRKIKKGGKSRTMRKRLNRKINNIKNKTRMRKNK